MATRFPTTLSVPITAEMSDALDALVLASGKPQTDIVRDVLAKGLGLFNPIEVELLAQLLFVRRVLLNGAAKANAIEQHTHRDAKLILAGKPLPYGGQE